MSNKLYIRFGKIPANEKSAIYQWADEAHSERFQIGLEDGVSVYEATDDLKIILPSITIEAIDTLNTLIKEEKCLYLVTGEEVGIGSDGEPLLKNVEILGCLK